MNIEILLGIFILVAIDNLNGRFLLVNVGDSDVEENHRMGDPAVDDDYGAPRLGEIAREPNSKLSDSTICTIPCDVANIVQCCEHDDPLGCLMIAPNYCDVCCPKPLKKQTLPSSNEEPRCKAINETCTGGFGCCSGLCKANQLRPEIGIDGVCVEKKDRPKKEGEACGQGCNDDCGECEFGLLCAEPGTSPTCKCGVCLNILPGK